MIEAAALQEVIDARGRGDFSPILPKLRALIEEDAREGDQ